MADDNSWVFDSLVCFLHGPVWNAPLQTFIEDKSIIFDPNLKPDEQNPEFRRVHDEYKNLVDYMLGTFMDEMHITPEQFEFACLEGRNSAAMSSGVSPSRADGGEGDANTFSFHQGLFQQIWAANDIRIFIRMMTQRNVEIQLQALDLIERRQASQASQDGGEGGPEEGEGLEERGTDTEVEIEQHIIKSVDDEVKENPMAAGSLVPNGPVGEDGTTLDEVAEASDKFQRLNLFFDQDKVNNDDMRVRQEYLRAQRDKILQIKKQARARQLNETIRKNPAERPASAQVAQKILEGGPDGTEPPESSMQLRKMLAQRLRNEVIEKE
ncbi:cilia- and flagella-associated protein 36 [Culex quinquefasciatus]|uniref:cilia- and flagella-associated protein 36 n=1 Tax=Culex quinquefasciatus TaxID=7176 RepID=UPI0018E39156|nr:cilia- and flagella-associated protein 36 [Culex quinquefasciatus]